MQSLFHFFNGWFINFNIDIFKNRVWNQSLNIKINSLTNIEYIIGCKTTFTFCQKYHYQYTLNNYFNFIELIEIKKLFEKYQENIIQKK